MFTNIAAVLHEAGSGIAIAIITQGGLWLRAWWRANRIAQNTAQQNQTRVKVQESSLAVVVLTDRLNACEGKLARRDAEVAALNEQHIKLARHAAVLEIRVSLARAILAKYKETIPDVVLPDELPLDPQNYKGPPL